MQGSKSSFDDNDLSDPILIRDIALSPHRKSFLEGKADPDAPGYCFMCRWILDDYNKNGTLTGVVREGGSDGKYEIFPIRGQINHLWIEMHGKPYPFKRKVIDDEMMVHGRKSEVVAQPVSQPVARPVAQPIAEDVSWPVTPEPEAPPPQADVPMSEIPVSKPRR